VKKNLMRTIQQDKKPTGLKDASEAKEYQKGWIPTIPHVAWWHDGANCIAV
jgi:hypothetical protein